MSCHGNPGDASWWRVSGVSVYVCVYVYVYMSGDEKCYELFSATILGIVELEKFIIKIIWTFYRHSMDEK